ncbi:MAG: hypothetical protein OEV94_10755 [Deltaproteobacteria bacterium]|nr:hypothetical protein [Deltaproteobacteria bacterium]
MPPESGTGQAATILQTLSDFIGIEAGKLIEVGEVLVAVGLLVMTLMELVKNMFHLRLFFHRWQVRRWLNARPNPRAYEQLILLATGSAPGSSPGLLGRMSGLLLGDFHPGDALFDQPTTKMMGQIQAAANQALDFPHLFPHVYGVLAAASPGTLSPEGETWLAYAQSLQGKSTKGKTPVSLEQALQAKTQVTKLAARKLDALQNKIDTLWAQLNQRVSVVSGALLIGYALSNGAGRETMSGWTIAGLAVMGGMISPFAKDVVSALAGLKKRG